MRNPKPLVLGMMLSLAAPVALVQAATSAPREAPKAPRAPRAPRAPTPPSAPEAPTPPTPPEPPDMPEVFVGRAMHLGQPRARLGTQVSTMTSALRTFFGAPEDAGLLIQHVEPGSAAEAAKVQVGDVLLEVDGQRIVHVSDVRDALGDRRKGDVVDVVVVRGKQRKTLKATLTTEADGPTAFTISSMPELHFELPPEARRFMGAEAQQQLERELDGVREQLREVERELDALRDSGALETPEPPAPPAPPKAKAKAKRAKKR